MTDDGSVRNLWRALRWASLDYHRVARAAHREEASVGPIARNLEGWSSVEQADRLCAEMAETFRRMGPCQ